MKRITGLAAAATLAASCAISTAAGTPAQAGPIEWCNPSSPLFDSTICYNDGGGGSYSCDPFGDAYNADYCAAQGHPRGRDH